MMNDDSSINPRISDRWDFLEPSKCVMMRKITSMMKTRDYKLTVK